MGTPKISLNKLGEYMEATPARRRKIVYDAKFPATFKTARYKDAREAIKAYIKSNYDESLIEACATFLEGKDTASDWAENDVESSLEALDAILEIDLPSLEDFTIEPFTLEASSIKIHEVEISIYPDLVIKGIIKGKPVVGVLKIHISKNTSLNEESSQYVAALLHQFADSAFSKEEADVSICISYDVFNGTWITAPKAVKRRMAHVEAACQEIALIWDSLVKV